MAIPSRGEPYTAIFGFKVIKGLWVVLGFSPPFYLSHILHWKNSLLSPSQSQEMLLFPLSLLWCSDFFPILSLPVFFSCDHNIFILDHFALIPFHVSS